MSLEERPKISDPAVMRALAHPARLAIMEYLNAAKTDATATECAEVVELSPSATSYHLRALAKAGMIEEAPSRGDGRERVWQTKFRTYSIEAGPDADPETRAAEEAVTEVFLARQDEKVRHWLAKGSEEQRDWYDAALLSETILLLTPDELTRLNERVLDLIKPYKARERADEPGAGARKVSFQLRTLPLG